MRACCVSVCAVDADGQWNACAAGFMFWCNANAMMDWPTNCNGFDFNLLFSVRSTSAGELMAYLLGHMGHMRLSGWLLGLRWVCLFVVCGDGVSRRAGGTATDETFINLYLANVERNSSGIGFCWGIWDAVLLIAAKTGEHTNYWALKRWMI